MHDVMIIQLVYFKFLNVNLGENLGIDLGKYSLESCSSYVVVSLGQ